MSLIPDADELRKIPSEWRSEYLVGAFLRVFAAMEFALDKALETMLGLDALRGIVVTKATPIAAKISMFRTLSSIALPNEQPNLANIASGLAKANDDRKIVAHTPFVASEANDGVKFIVMSTKDKFRFPDADWSISDFRSKISAMEAVQEKLEARLAQQTYSAVAKALARGPTAKRPLGGLLAIRAPDTDD